MKKSLKITIVQTTIHWENRDENLIALSRKLNDSDLNTDLIILPEMFNTGFTKPTDELAESMGGPTINWMRKLSRDKEAVVTGSLIVKENDNYYNRLAWVEPWDITGTYDKRHLFRMAGEHKDFKAGKEKLVKEYKGWRICPLICYDLRFPVWSRNQNDYDVLIYIANWPAPRRDAWNILLKARAIENQCYVVGVNRVGDDGNDIHYAGDSVVIDPKGEVISGLKPEAEGIETVEIDYELLSSFRNSFPVGLDADEFKIQ